ncbi:helix-turn-helix domain-containing protein [Streptomyces sp.]|uniref:helix-turn-helix domain-containing protein n=1 Tax=Streptomyces sp. TaxID=1931 RepID=UPI0034547EEE
MTQEAQSRQQGERLAERYLVVRELVDGLPIMEVAQRYGISRHTGTPPSHWRSPAPPSARASP